MNLYLFIEVDEMSDNYHSNGSVLVIAETEKRARTLANSNAGCNIRPVEFPSYCCRTSENEEKVFYFPNAGCC